MRSASGHAAGSVLPASQLPVQLPVQSVGHRKPAAVRPRCPRPTARLPHPPERSTFGTCSMSREFEHFWSSHARIRLVFQAWGKRRYDNRSDFWNMAIVLRKGVPIIQKSDCRRCLPALDQLTFSPRHLCSPLRHIMQQIRHQRRPAGLVARAEAAAGVAVEVLVEQHQVAPVRIVGVARVVAVAGPAACRRRAGRGASAARPVRRRPPSGSSCCPSRSGIRPAACRRRSGDSAPALRSSR